MDLLQHLGSLMNPLEPFEAWMGRIPLFSWEAGKQTAVTEGGKGVSDMPEDVHLGISAQLKYFWTHKMRVPTVGS